MITGINKSRTLTRHISSEFKCKFDAKNIIQINGGTTIDVDMNIKCYM